ncbi:MAG: endonuclease [Leptolyngbyaceae cyanobacterium bins.349]|nr:endonuclease [Leptolyngbyaceae cyanobacterium bins.349]
MTQVLQDTEARFRDRTPIRTENCQKLEAGLPLQADTPERVEKRLKRLGFDASTAKMLVGSDLSAIPSPVDSATAVSTQERILNTNDLIGVNFLERGANVARSVARIRARASNGNQGFGTGFLVSPRLLLTNNHVLPDVQAAALSRVEFDYQDGADGNPKQAVVFDLEPNTLFLTDVKLDYTLVAVQPTSRNGTSLAGFGWLPLIEAEGKVIVGESVSIIQHPDGDPKQVALRGNKLVDVLPDFLHYETDTAPGSSGSPVFNDQWEIVALHHSGVPQRNNSGQIVNIYGKPWAKEQGENLVAWIANEGVRISRIIAHVKSQIKSQPIAAEGQSLMAAMFNGNHPPSTNPGAEIMSPASDSVPQIAIDHTSSLPQASEDGTITWTIPLQVSVRLGSPIIQGQSVTVVAAPSPAPVLAPPPPASSQAPTSSTPPALEAPTDKDLKDALKDLKGAAKKPYYDETSDRNQRETYYQSLLSQLQTLSKAELYQELRNLVMQTHTQKLRYQPSKYLYSWVDLHPDLKIRSIYSEQVFEAEDFIRADFRVDQLRAVRSQELLLKESLSEVQFLQELDVLEASLPYNCEHVVPQSWFAKKEPMRGDLHHLFACETRCNSFRGNTPYYDFEDFGTVIRDSCGKLIGEKFEPNAGKGAVARATLYFLLRYPGEINKTEREYQSDRLAILLDWHQSYPVSQYEKHRNVAISTSQGNRNPLIDFPEWAEKIDFRLGLG